MSPTFHKFIVLQKTKKKHKPTHTKISLVYKALEIKGLQTFDDEFAFKLLLVEKPWAEKRMCHLKL